MGILKQLIAREHHPALSCIHFGKKSLREHVGARGNEAAAT